MSEFQKEAYDITEIMKVLPHRYPFLLVDKVTEIHEKGGKGYKNVSMNEEFFQGHFPGKPVMPGVLIIEGMAQCSGFIALKILEKTDPHFDAAQGKIIYFMMIDKAKFRRPVVPGDRLDFEIEVLKLSSRIARFMGYAKVNGELAAEAEMTAMLENR
jgi:3-hydroxyacyl-[acyl-carrier-protein] dehydratase